MIMHHLYDLSRGGSTRIHVSAIVDGSEDRSSGVHGSAKPTEALSSISVGIFVGIEKREKGRRRRRRGTKVKPAYKWPQNAVQLPQKMMAWQPAGETENKEGKKVI